MWPETWLALDAHSRDVLVALRQHGDQTMVEVWKRIGGVEGRTYQKTTRDRLNDLIDAGLVERDGGQGRQQTTYSLTFAGQEIVGGVVNRWDEL